MAKDEEKVRSWMLGWATDIEQDPLREYRHVARRTAQLALASLFVGMVAGAAFFALGVWLR